MRSIGKIPLLLAQRVNSNAKVMFERVEYTVARIDGDYAYLQRVDDPSAEEKCVARALLPAEISEGCRVAYEMLEYSMA